MSRRGRPMLRETGRPGLASTDVGYLNSFNYPCQGLHDELQRYVEAVLTPAEALASATINGPAFLGYSDRFGALAEGKAADLLILDTNPLEDISATRRIEAVILKGQLLDRSEEHTSELQSLMRISYDVFCLTQQNNKTLIHHLNTLTHILKSN